MVSYRRPHTLYDNLEEALGEGRGEGTHAYVYLADRLVQSADTLWLGRLGDDREDGQFVQHSGSGEYGTLEWWCACVRARASGEGLGHVCDDAVVTP